MPGLTRWLRVGFQDIGRGQAQIEDQEWIAPTLAGLWVAFTATISPRYRKDALSQVQLSGAVKSGAASSTIFTLPSGYRPIIGSHYAVPMANSGGTLFVGEVDVTDAGVVLYNNTGATPARVSLAGISFRADGS